MRIGGYLVDWKLVTRLVRSLFAGRIRPAFYDSCTWCKRQKVTDDFSMGLCRQFNDMASSPYLDTNEWRWYLKSYYMSSLDLNLYIFTENSQFEPSADMNFCDGCVKELETLGIIKLCGEYNPGDEISPELMAALSRYSSGDQS